VLLVMVLALPSALPLMLTSQGPDIVQEACGCGCGNPKGSCCCTAPSATGLAMRCAIPNEPTADSPHLSPLMGPPESIQVPRPLSSAGEPIDQTTVFDDLEPRLETPPPRA
jgi:hypothetical protein